MSGLVVVFAFDPVDELGGRAGVLPLAPDLAERLVAAHRVERVEAVFNDSLRFVTGSAANVAARDALRAARAHAREDTVAVAEVAPEPALERRPRGRPRKVR